MVRRGSGLLTVFGIALLAAVAIAPAAQAKGPLYVVGGNSNAVGVHQVGADGSLGAFSPVATVPTPRSAVIRPNAQTLYTTGANQDNIGPHPVDPSTGTLGALGTPAAAVQDPEGPAITPDDRFLYAANEQGNSISRYSIDQSTGALTPLGQVALVNPNGIAITPDGSKLYASSDTGIQPYTIAADGAITVNGALVPGSNPRAIAITPNGQFLYAANANGNNISGYSIGADGTLTPVGTPAPAGPTPFGLAITQSGQFLYTANFTDPGTANAYMIGPDGVLSPVPGQPFPTGSQFPYAVDAAPNGRVYVANDVQGGNPGTVTAFDVAADGALTAIGSPVTTVTAPEFQSIIVLPNQGPTASFTPTPRSAGTATAFNATGSSDPQGGAVTRFDWDFGDGTTLANGGPTPSHVYAQPGSYNVTLTVTDDEGCSTQLIFTGQTADCNGSGAARSQQTITVPPGDPKLKLSGKRKQELARSVVVKARTVVDTTAVAKGRLSIEPGKNGKRALASLKLKKHRKALVAGRKTKLKPKLSKKTYNAARKALSGGGKVTAKVTVKATSAGGVSDKAKRKIKLLKP